MPMDAEVPGLIPGVGSFSAFTLILLELHVLYLSIALSMDVWLFSLSLSLLLCNLLGIGYPSSLLLFLLNLKQSSTTLTTGPSLSQSLLSLSCL